MADYPFKINITTKDNIKISFYTGSLATNADTVVSASVMVDRINNMKSGSNFVDSIEAPTSLAAHSSTFYGETGGLSPTGANNGIKWLSASFDHPNTGSITFTDTETAASGGLDHYEFYGTKVCSVLGLPEGVPVYTENFKLSDSSTDTTNYISGEFISDRVALKKGFKMSPQARVQSNLVWDHAFGEGYIQWVSGSTSKMSMGYDNVNDQYKLSAPTASVNRLEASTAVAAKNIDLFSGTELKIGRPIGSSLVRIYIGDGELVRDGDTINHGDSSLQAIAMGCSNDISMGIRPFTGGEGTSVNSTTNKMLMESNRTTYELSSTGGVTIKSVNDTTWASSLVANNYQLLLQCHSEAQNSFAGIAFQVGDDDTGGLNDIDAINGAIAVLRDNTTNNLMDGNMIFATNDDADGDLTERMRITHDGKVGIGNNDPSATLDVTGTINCTSTLSIPGFANVSASLATATGGSGMSNFGLAGDGGSNQSITDGNTVTIAGGNGITTTGASTDTVSVAVDAAQTTITSIYATDLAIGEDSQTRLDFGEVNKIRFYANNQLQMQLSDGVFQPASDSDVDLGTSSVRWKDVYVDSIDISGSISNDDGAAVFKRTSTGTNSVLNVRQLSTGTVAEFGTASDGERVLIEAGGNILADGNISGSSTSTGSFGALNIDGGHFTSASLASGGGGAVSAVANGADNRIATFSSADALNGETYLTFDGVNLKNLHNSATIYAAASISSSAAGTGSFGCVESVGAIRAGDDVIAFHSSDERLKNNITIIENPIDKVKQLRGIEYEWNELQHNYPSGSKDSGIIAQDVQKVLPQIVKEKRDGYLGVRHDRLVGLLIESVKEQQQQIDELEKKVEELKNASS